MNQGPEPDGDLKKNLALTREIIAIIEGLLAILGVSSLGAIAAYILNHHDLVYFLIGFGALALTLILRRLWQFFRKRRRKPVSAPQPSPDPPVKWLLQGYKLLRMEYDYHILDQKRVNHSQAIAIKLKALHRGVELLELRYNWTGSGDHLKDKPPRSVTPGHTLLGSVSPANTLHWRYYYVHFGHELPVGQEVVTRIEHNLYDPRQQFRPYLAKTISEPLDQLSLKVRMPAVLQPEHIQFIEQSGNSLNGTTLSTLPGVFTRDGAEVVIQWEPPELTFGHRYLIEWRYGNTPP